MDHRFDARRLLRRHVEQRVRAGAHADRLDAIDAELIEQGKEIARDIGELEDAAGIGRSSVTAKIGRDDAIARQRLGEDVLPVVAGSGEAVKE